MIASGDLMAANAGGACLPPGELRALPAHAIMINENFL